eukprot:926195-Rhodomonas_salina.1
MDARTCLLCCMRRFAVLSVLKRSPNGQVKRLAEALNAKGIEAKAMNFPNRTTAVGSVINAYLQSGQDLGQ